MSSWTNRVCPKCGEEDLVREDYCSTCGYDFNSGNGQISSSSDDLMKPLFFPVSTRKLAIMSFATLGSYQVYWFYKNWKLIKEREGSNISPFVRTMFSIFYCYSLVNGIKKAAVQHRVNNELNLGVIVFSYVIFYLMAYMPEPTNLIAVFSFIPILSVQSLVNDLNAKTVPQIARNDKISVLNIAVIIAGSMCWLLLIFAELFPESALH